MIDLGQLAVEAARGSAPSPWSPSSCSPRPLLVGVHTAPRHRAAGPRRHRRAERGAVRRRGARLPAGHDHHHAARHPAADPSTSPSTTTPTLLATAAGRRPLYRNDKLDFWALSRWDGAPGAARAGTTFAPPRDRHGHRPRRRRAPTGVILLEDPRIHTSIARCCARLHARRMLDLEPLVGFVLDRALEPSLGGTARRRRRVGVEVHVLDHRLSSRRTRRTSRQPQADRRSAISPDGTDHGRRVSDSSDVPSFRCSPPVRHLVSRNPSDDLLS